MILLTERNLTSEFVCAIIGCKEESLPIRYLRIPIGIGKTTRRDRVL